MTGIQYSNSGYSLAIAIDKLMAYDHGDIARGINNPTIRASVRRQLEGLDDDEHRRFCATYARAFLLDSAIDQGRGIEDVVEFAGWLERLSEEG